MLRPPTDRERLDFMKDRVRRQISHLQSIIGRLDLYDEPSSSAEPQGEAAVSSRVFLVHGHDDSSKETVARFLEKLKLEVIILHEQPNQGRTVIEKFEDHSDVGFAVVLLTADEEASTYRSPDSKEIRPRPNVVLELGYFIGKLGRPRVCPLLAPGVAPPSDIHGVVYLPLDLDGDWRVTLARELKAAHVPFDPSALL